MQQTERETPHKFHPAALICHMDSLSHLKATLEYKHQSTVIFNCQTCPLLKPLGVLSQNKRLGLGASVSQSVEYWNKGRIKESGYLQLWIENILWNRTDMVHHRVTFPFIIEGKRCSTEKALISCETKKYHIHFTAEFFKGADGGSRCMQPYLASKKAVSIKPTLQHNSDRKYIDHQRLGGKQTTFSTPFNSYPNRSTNRSMAKIHRQHWSVPLGETIGHKAFSKRMTSIQATHMISKHSCCLMSKQ